MEVHHHPIAIGSHTSRRKFTHYFWEFLMLFLAVFCGFLAENQREHFIEHNREKQFAASLLEDLRHDTADLNENIPFWERYNRKIDTIRMELEKDPSTRNHELLYVCISALQNNNKFQYSDRTITQLKNAGNFRLIRKKIITDSLVSYDNMIVTVISNVQESFDQHSFARAELQDQLFNSKLYVLRNDIHYREIVNAAGRDNPAIIGVNKNKEDILFRFYNKLYAILWVNNARIRFEKTLLRQAGNLIELIKKEYKLK
jgi:hypothetical protein